MPLEADTINPHSQIPQQLLPPPPPLPNNTSTSTSTSTSKTTTLRTKPPSPFIQKLQHAPAAAAAAKIEIARASPVGWYFLYGTLMDPSFLAEVLLLGKPSHGRPEMRPARIVGSYAVKMWGQYPALLDVGEEEGGGGGAGREVHVYGMACRVREKKDAVRLAEYETRAYRPAPCSIELTTDEDGDDDYDSNTGDDDGGDDGDDGDDGVDREKDSPVRGRKGTVLQGYAFKFRDGNESELREGSFDLKNWLRLVGR